MLKEEIIRKENKEISELILTILKNLKKDYREKENKEKNYGECI